MNHNGEGEIYHTTNRRELVSTNKQHKRKKKKRITFLPSFAAPIVVHWLDRIGDVLPRVNRCKEEDDPIRLPVFPIGV